MDREADELLAVAVAMNFLSAAKARRAKERYRDIPPSERPPFSRWIVANRLLTPREVRLLADPRKRVLRCPACPQEFDVTGIDPGRQFECPRCASLVTVPAPPDSSPAQAPPPPSDAEGSFGGPEQEALPEQEELSRHLASRGFELLDKIGQGGMGAVFLAWDRKLNRKVAVKVLLSGVLATQSQIERFEREAKAVAALNHPAIVRIHSLGSHRGFHYYIMDYVEGMSLDHLIAQGPMNPVKAARLCTEICDAIHHAHRAGVIHRDLKPANILLDENGRPYVADFGLAKIEDAASTLTESGVAIGTPYYMSPEQASGDVKRINERSDVYSLGVILYEMLCGRVPFEGKRAVDVMMKVMNEDPPPPSSVRKGIPAELEAIALKAMSKEPAERYADAGEMAADLQAFLAGMTVSARPPGPVRRMARSLRRHPVLLAGLVAALGSLLFYVAFFNAVVPKRDPATPVLNALSVADAALEEGEFAKVAKILEAASGMVSDRRVMERADALKERFLARLTALYDGASGLEDKAAALALLMSYLDSEEATRVRAGRFASETAARLKEILASRGPQAAGGLLSSLQAKLGTHASVLDGVTAAFCDTLAAEAAAREKSGDIDGAMERLQVLLMFRPSDKKAAASIERLKSSREDRFFNLVARVMQKIGFGTAEITGAHHGCKVSITSLTQDYGAPLESDLRVQNSFLLKNGFYLFRFEREGYEPIERKVAVEAERKVVIRIAEDDWVKVKANED